MGTCDALRTRMDRWRAFHSSKTPGDLLFYLGGERGASLEGFLCQQFKDNPPERVLEEARIPGMIEQYVAQLRQAVDAGYRLDDDATATALVYWGIGALNAAITGGEPFHDGYTSWFDPNLDWPRIDELAFDPDNQWVRFAVAVNRQLWRLWEGDFHVLPFLYRSPLDAANGVRGNELFVELYTDPARVHRLIDWCVDWTLQMEAHLADQAPPSCPTGWGRAVWGAWLPDRAVFVNGDPVGLISPASARQFEQPYTARLFTATGGGFFHNHTIGLYQAALVSRTPGTLVQWFVDDPGQPTAAAALLDIPPLREELLAASLDAPIGLWGVPLNRLDEFLDIARHGRFILGLCPPPDAPAPDLARLLRRARAASNLA